MGINIFKVAAVALFVVFLIPAGMPTALAIDSDGRYFAYGVGDRSCEDYVKFREKKLESLERRYDRYTKDELYEIVNKVVEHWIAGFLTAADLFMADTYNIAGKTTMDDLKARLESICRANSKEHFASAMVTLVQQLNPQRVKADTGK